MNIENKKNDATENLKDGYEQIKIHLSNTVRKVKNFRRKTKYVTCF